MSQDGGSPKMPENSGFSGVSSRSSASFALMAPFGGIEGAFRRPGKS